MPESGYGQTTHAELRKGADQLELLKAEATGAPTRLCRVRRALVCRRLGYACGLAPTAGLDPYFPDAAAFS